MVKKIITIFLVLLVVAGMGFLAFFLNSNGWFATKEFKIVSDGAFPNNYPEIKWSDITTGILARSLQKLDKQNKLPNLPDKIVPVTKFQKSSQSFFILGGISYIELTEDDLKSQIYAEKPKRPYQFVAFFKTSLDSSNYLLLIQKWVNQDKTISFIPVLVPQTLAINSDNTITDYYADILDGSLYFYSPILKYKSQSECTITLQNDNAYCKWYFQNQKAFEKIESLWTNKIPKNIGSYPVQITRSQIKR